MSRVAKAPVNIPAGVEVKLDGQLLTVKGKNGELSRKIHESVEVKQDNGQFTFTPREGFVEANAQSGTARALVNAMVIGTIDPTRALNIAEQFHISRQFWASLVEEGCWCTIWTAFWKNQKRSGCCIRGRHRDQGSRLHLSSTSR